MIAVCVGHASFDTTMPINEFPEENHKYRIGDCIECGGGPASNAAYLLAKWGVDTTFAGMVGDDYYGERIIEEFRDVGANIRYIEKIFMDNTSSSYILANKSNGSRTIITDKIIPIRKLSQDVMVKADIIEVDGEHPETAMQVLNNNPHALSVLDAGRVTDDTKMIGKMVTYVACSKDFAETFTDKKIDINNMDTIIEIYEELKAYFDTNIIITLEEKGTFTKIDDYEIIKSIEVEAVDSTGAGDIFHGALTYFLGRKYPLRRAIRLSNITAALSVTKLGSRTSIPNLTEVLKVGEEVEVI